MKLINKLKNYKPSKAMSMLYLFIPIVISILFIDIKEQGDIWFLLNHGKYVLNQGFPTIEPFTIHQGLSFVMQQWLSSVIFYLAYCLSPKFGLFIVCFIINILILFFTYKLCMLLTKNNYRRSIFLTITVDFLLLLFRFITPRPQIFTYLLLIITLYIMELFIENRKTKALYFLPLISLLQINLHSSMYFIHFVFLFPYFIYFLINKIKNKKDNRIFKLIIFCLIMLLTAFINPYGIKNIFYIFNSYGNNYINEIIEEMQPLTIVTTDGLIFYLMLFIMIIFLLKNKNKLNLRNILLVTITIILTLYNRRNIALFIISIPLILLNLKEKSLPKEKIKINKNYILILSLYLLIIIPLFLISPTYPQSKIENGINKLLVENNINDIKLYVDFDDGAYTEWRGIKSYIDGRAEIFLKSLNKKENIFYEFYLVNNGKINYQKFLDKYDFTHLIVKRDSYLNQYLLTMKNYNIIYQEKNYVIYQKA